MTTEFNTSIILPLSSDNLKKHDQGKKIYRFFGCRKCDFFFWKTVFEFKPVAKCFKCYIKLDALPKEFERGKGYFVCPNCNNEWTNFPCNNQTGQPCLKCGNQSILPFKLGPNRIKGPKVTFRKHRCDNCKNGTCQQHSRVYSAIHTSTGSTISDISSLMSKLSIKSNKP